MRIRIMPASRSRVRPVELLMLVSCLVFAESAPAFGNLLANPGFEGAAPELTLPGGPGVWGGDLASSAAAENGIVPFEGFSMLRFDGTFWSCPEGGTGSDIHQLVSPAPAPGSRARLLLRVNRVTGDAMTDTDFHVRLRAYSGDPLSFDENEPLTPVPLAEEISVLHSDGDPSTWEEVAVELLVPEGTTYLGVVMSAVENVFNDHTCPFGEFDGHYADDARLIVVDDLSDVEALDGASANCFHPPSPSPFGQSTWFRFSLEVPEDAALEIFDVGGRRLRTLVHGPVSRGLNVVTWDGRDADGVSVPPGIYLVRLTSGAFQEVRRVVLNR